MKFYLVRHGQTDWNKEERLQGQTDVPLNDEGRRQITELAEKMAAADLHFDRVISSPLVRAYESAQIIVDKIGFDKEIIIENDFTERNFGLLEGKPWDPNRDMDDPKYQTEKISEVCDRAGRGLAKYNFDEDERILIVAHGALLPAVKYVLSDGRIAYGNKDVPIIQGNVMCCERKDGQELSLYNLF
ncbi:histidine phosphatase family protein [Butyrivibrio sp. VCD2006]|uniref:histidine phosphatase family protein n=1 Tax=Butyrivibrio sp. VCD2006 TaxID=1280664 RepID=UPI00040B4282|nr:histidine phosphatase family protein [Butyrivibrio sp. VCD2006]